MAGGGPAGLQGLDTKNKRIRFCLQINMDSTDLLCEVHLLGEQQLKSYQNLSAKEWLGVQNCQKFLRAPAEQYVGQ